MKAIFGRTKIKSGDQFLQEMVTSKNRSKFLLELTDKESENFLNYRDNQGNTALHIAASLEDADAFILLCLKGADQSIKNTKDETAIQIGTLSNRTFLEKLIQENLFVDFTVTNSKGQNIIHSAIEAGNFDLADFLSTPQKKYKPPINSQDNNGDTALHYLVRERDLAPLKAVALINHMKKNGADLSIENNEGRTVAEEAIVNGNIEVALAVIKTLSLNSSNPEHNKKRNELFALAQKHRSPEELNQINEVLGPPKRVETRERTKSTSTVSTSSLTDEESTKKTDIYDELGADTKFLVELQKHYGDRFNTQITDKLVKYVTRKMNFDKETAPATEEMSRIKAKFEKSPKDHHSLLDPKEFLKIINDTDKDFESWQKIKSYERLQRKTKEYEEGRASKGLHHLLAEPLKIFGRKTDNEMIQALTEEYKKYEKDSNYQVQLPQRWNSKKSKGLTK